MGRNKLAYVIAIVFFAILAVLILFIPGVWGGKGPIDYPIPNTVRLEIIKGLLQLLVVVVIGGSVAYFFKLQEENRKKALEAEAEARKEDKLKSEIRMEYFKRLGNSYRKVKNARRILRAGGLTSKYNNTPLALSEMQSVLYIQQLEELNQAQLALEELKIEAGSLPAFIDIDNVPGCLKTMEEYLRRLLKEFERVSPLLKSKQQVDFMSLERLDEFTGTTDRDFKFLDPDPKKCCRLRKDFSEPYAGVIKTLSENLR